MDYYHCVKYYGFNNSDEPIAALLLMASDPYRNPPLTDRPSWSVLMLPLTYAEAAQD